MKFMVLMIEDNENNKDDLVNEFAVEMASVCANYAEKDLTSMDMLPVVSLIEARCKQDCLDEIDDALDRRDGNEGFEFN